MAMPEPPENYEWSVLLGNSSPGFYAIAHVFLRPKYGHFGDKDAKFTYSLPAYCEDGAEETAAIEGTAKLLLEKKDEADANLQARMALANEWSESLGCEVRV